MNSAGRLQITKEESARAAEISKVRAAVRIKSDGMREGEPEEFLGLLGRLTKMENTTQSSSVPC